MDTTTLGARGEDAAVAHALARGAKLVARNWRGARRGSRYELDLVLEDGGVLAFAEVKTRTTSTCGSALEAVTPLKARRLTRAALLFLQDRRLSLDTACRFDVFAVDGSTMSVEWLKDAFPAIA
jgi:putative endonuclease